MIVDQSPPRGKAPMATTSRRLSITPDSRGWRHVSLAPSLSMRDRARLALGGVRARHRAGIRPPVTPADIAAVRPLVGVPDAVVLLDDGGAWGVHYAGMVGTLTYIEPRRGRVRVRIGGEEWDDTGCPLWLIDVVPGGDPDGM